MFDKTYHLLGIEHEGQRARFASYNGEYQIQDRDFHWRAIQLIDLPQGVVAWHCQSDQDYPEIADLPFVAWDAGWKEGQRMDFFEWAEDVHPDWYKHYKALHQCVLSMRAKEHDGFQFKKNYRMIEVRCGRCKACGYVRDHKWHLAPDDYSCAQMQESEAAKEHSQIKDAIQWLTNGGSRVVITTYSDRKIIEMPNEKWSTILALLRELEFEEHF